MAVAPYGARDIDDGGATTPDGGVIYRTRNANDSVYTSQSGSSCVLSLTGSPATGYTASVTLAVNPLGDPVGGRRRRPVARPVPRGRRKPESGRSRRARRSGGAVKRGLSRGALRRALALFGGAALAACSPAGAGDGARSDASVPADGSPLAGGDARDAAVTDAGDADEGALADDSGGAAPDAATITLTSTGFLQADGGGLLFAPSACGGPAERVAAVRVGERPFVRAEPRAHVRRREQRRDQMGRLGHPADDALAPRGSPSDAKPAGDPRCFPARERRERRLRGARRVPGPPYHTYEFVPLGARRRDAPGTKSGQSTGSDPDDAPPRARDRDERPLRRRGAARRSVTARPFRHSQDSPHHLNPHREVQSCARAPFVLPSSSPLPRSSRRWPRQPSPHPCPSCVQKRYGPTSSEGRARRPASGPRARSNRRPAVPPRAAARAAAAPGRSSLRWSSSLPPTACRTALRRR